MSTSVDDLKRITQAALQELGILQTVPHPCQGGQVLLFRVDRRPNVSAVVYMYIYSQRICIRMILALEGNYFRVPANIDQDAVEQLVNCANKKLERELFSYNQVEQVIEQKQSIEFAVGSEEERQALIKSGFQDAMQTFTEFFMHFIIGLT